LGAAETLGDVGRAPETQSTRD